MIKIDVYSFYDQEKHMTITTGYNQRITIQYNKIRIVRTLGTTAFISTSGQRIVTIQNNEIMRAIIEYQKGGK